jgi:NMT1/THI5 like
MVTSPPPERCSTAGSGGCPPSNILDLELRTALYAEAIYPDKLRSLSSEPGQALADLAGHRVDAAVGSVWELPWQARERGVALKSFNPGGYRVEYYGDSLFTLQRLAKTDPTLVQRFREASVKGWEYALQHPEEIAARILTELPIQVAMSDPAGFTRYQTEVARELARYPDVPLGHSNPERWGRIQQSLIEIGEITQPADLDAFLYNPDAAARHRSDWQATIVTAAALLAVAGSLWRWGTGRGRSAAPAGAAIGDREPSGTGLARTATLFAETRKFADRIAIFLNQLRGHIRMQSRLTPLRAAASRQLNPLRTLGSPGNVQSRLARLRAAASEALSRLASETRRITVSSGGNLPGSRPTDLNMMLTTYDADDARSLHPATGSEFGQLPLFSAARAVALPHRPGCDRGDDSRSRCRRGGRHGGRWRPDCWDPPICHRRPDRCRTPGQRCWRLCSADRQGQRPRPIPRTSRQHLRPGGNH